MKRRFCITFLLLVSAAFAQDEGEILSRAELVREIPANQDHPVPREVIAALEEEISCEPVPKDVLVIHYRAEPTARFSMNDDLVVVAEKQGTEYRVLKVLESDTVVNDGELLSENDFETDFIRIGEWHFLYVRTRVSGSAGAVMDDVYTISSDNNLSLIPFDDMRNSRQLKPGEELRNGGFRFEKGEFSFDAGVYNKKDAECCPSAGWFHAEFKLTGDFGEDSDKDVYNPEFRFVVAKESRGDDR
jgi:hypothetical protein